MPSERRKRERMPSEDLMRDYRQTHRRCAYDGKLIFESQQEAQEAAQNIESQLGQPLYVYRRHKIWHLTTETPREHKERIRERNARKNAYRRIAWGLRRIRDNGMRRAS